MPRGIHPKAPQEVWLVVPHETITMGFARKPDPSILLLLGFHPSTKALMHTYGPFLTPDELRTFAAAERIKLPLWEALDAEA